MVKFESPEIDVVMFSETEVITTSTDGGYSGNENQGGTSQYSTVIGGIDGDFPL